MREKIVEYVKLIRLPGWGGYCIPAVFGALSVGVFDVWKLALLFFIGGLATIYGFVLNDYADVSTDSLSKDLSERPLVKGVISRENALYISILAAITVYIIILLAMITKMFLFSYTSLLILTISAILTACYNFYGKKLVGSDIFVATATALFCLFGAMVVSDKIGALTGIIVIVTFIQVLYMNAIVGGLKDVDHDFLIGAKNIALRMGVKAKKELFIPRAFKALALALRFCSAVFMFVPMVFLKDFSFYIWQPLIMLVMFIGVFYTTIKMLNMKMFDRNQIRKLISVQAFLRYSVVPVMLLRFIGNPISLFLIIFPFSWYAIFNCLIYGKAIQPRTL